MAVQPETGVRIAVAIVENTVCGINAYRARCLRCGWECHQQPHDAQRTAVRHAQAHLCDDLKGA